MTDGDWDLLTKLMRILLTCVDENLTISLSTVAPIVALDDTTHWRWKGQVPFQFDQNTCSSVMERLEIGSCESYLGSKCPSKNQVHSS